ncbi:MAG: DUF4159 domain-containing protein [Methylacidiphilales bacterium]|nr:DUF4159 domain-containing protein [Candidatus Methylacidiphilales bacterium]
MAQKKPQWLKEKLNRSSFFFIALFLHVVVLAMVATIVIFKPTILSTPDFEKTYVPVGGPPPPPPQQQVTVKVPTVSVPTTAPPIVSVNPAASFNIQPPDITAVVDATKPAQTQTTQITPPPQTGLGPRLPLIRATVGHWRSQQNILNSDGDVRNIVAKFPVYLAKYANGDWNCNSYGGNSKIPSNGIGPVTGGCLPNLVYQIGLWSHGSLKGEDVKVIAIDSPELLSDPPPYIYFTGHRDFTLTEAEIENLQKYLQAGGAVWGDSSFSGDGSRFDVAFHREMKRVLPDVDKNFEVLPLTHDIFTHSWFLIDKVPPGMNYRADPVEIINLDGKLAVIYTPNDYSDMMTMLLLAGASPAQVDPKGFGPFAPTPAHPLFTQWGMWTDRTTFYRNFDPASVEDCYKLSMNILAHLLIRFDKDLNGAP